MADDDDFVQMHARADDIDTSKRAARLAEPNAMRHKVIILEALEKYGPLTSEEISKRTGLSLWQCGRRVPDLRADGFVVDTGFRRRNDSGREAAVWGLVKDQGELQLNERPKRKGRKALEDENARLREALQKLYDGCVALDNEQAILPQQMRIAREALDE